MKALTFRLHLLQPVLITKVGSGEENSSTSYDFILGSAIRGAIIQKYLRYHAGEDISKNAEGRKLFFDGETIYLNGYLQDSRGQRMIPTPLSWREEKDQTRNDGEQHLWDFALLGLEAVSKMARPQLPHFRFVSASAIEGKYNYASPQKYIQLHNASTERHVKKVDKSFVFRYDTLAKDQVFAAAVLSKDQGLLEIVSGLLENEILFLGGSRSAGYGQVKVENIELQSAADWSEAPMSSPAITNRDLTIITLLSDAIVHDAYGQYQVDLSPYIPALPVATFARTSVEGGFNRKWGLPSPQSPVIQAGSVFVYRSSDIDQAKILSLRELGLGGRRVAGYGRIAVNWNSAQDFVVHNDNVSPEDFAGEHNQIEIEKLPQVSREMIARFWERDLRNILEKKLAWALTQLSLTGHINNSQLGRIRQVILSLKPGDGYEPILAHLQGLKSAKPQFERTRVDGQPLLNWLEEGLKYDRIWDKYLQPLPTELLNLPGIKAEVPDEIKVEYICRLLDGLFRKVSQDNQQEGDIQ